MKVKRNKPLHLQIATILESEIKKGNLKPGEKLAPEEALAKDFEVSRATIREALRILEHEHYIVSKHGSGTFVSENVFFISNALNQLRSTTEMADASGLNIHKKFIELKVEIADKIVRDSLGLDKNERVIKIERVGFIKEEPILYSIDIFPLKIAPDLINRTSFDDSLLAFLEEKYNIEVVCANATVSAVNSIDWPISDFQKKIPALLFEQIHYDQNQKPVIYHHRHGKQALHIHFANNIQQVIIRMNHFDLSIHDLSQKNSIIHYWVKQVLPNIIQMDHPQKLSGIFIFHREIVPVGFLNNGNKIPQQHILIDDNTILFNKLRNIQIRQNPGVGTGSQQVSVFHKILQIIGCRLEIMAERGRKR